VRDVAAEINAVSRIGAGRALSNFVRVGEWVFRSLREGGGGGGDGGSEVVILLRSGRDYGRLRSQGASGKRDTKDRSWLGLFSNIWLIMDEGECNAFVILLDKR